MRKLTGLAMVGCFCIIGIMILKNMLFLDIISAEDNQEIVSKSTAVTPFYCVIIIVGGCIAVTLSYVSWRKYKGEEKKEQLKKDKTVD